MHWRGTYQTDHCLSRCIVSQIWRVIIIFFFPQTSDTVYHDAYMYICTFHSSLKLMRLWEKRGAVIFAASCGLCVTSQSLCWAGREIEYNLPDLKNEANYISLKLLVDILEWGIFPVDVVVVWIAREIDKKEKAMLPNTSRAERLDKVKTNPQEFVFRKH